MATKKNYYAVRNGRHTGIYKTWAECLREVQGFPGALFKGFVHWEEAQAYLNDKQEKTERTASSDECRIFVDGSYYQGRYSWGLAVYQNGILIHTDCGVGDSPEAAQLHNVAGEVEAAMQAAQWADRTQQPSFVIVHDYLGISEWAEGRWKTNTPLTKTYCIFMQKYAGRMRFEKVTGHTGVEGNEVADKLAKKALGIN